MAIFIPTGTTVDDYWLVDGSKDFSFLPANTLTGWTIDLPIRLHVGNISFGQIHMQKHLYQFNDRQKRNVPELIHYKLGQGADIYGAETKVKIKFKCGLAPNALITLERRYTKLGDGAIDEYLSLVTFYPPRIPPDGMKIGRYDSSFQRQAVANAKAAAQAAAAAAAAAQQTAGSPPQPVAPVKAEAAE